MGARGANPPEKPCGDSVGGKVRITLGWPWVAPPPQGYGEFYTPTGSSREFRAIRPLHLPTRHQIHIALHGFEPFRIPPVLGDLELHLDRIDLGRFRAGVIAFLHPLPEPGPHGLQKFRMTSRRDRSSPLQVCASAWRRAQQELLQGTQRETSTDPGWIRRAALTVSDCRFVG